MSCKQIPLSFARTIVALVGTAPCHSADGTPRNDLLPTSPPESKVSILYEWVIWLCSPQSSKYYINDFGSLCTIGIRIPLTYKRKADTLYTSNSFVRFSGAFWAGHTPDRASYYSMCVNTRRRVCGVVQHSNCCNINWLRASGCGIYICRYRVRRSFLYRLCRLGPLKQRSGAISWHTTRKAITLLMNQRINSLHLMVIGS